MNKTMHIGRLTKDIEFTHTFETAPEYGVEIEIEEV
jgi:single-stranded DNA-binding protein